MGFGHHPGNRRAEGGKLNSFFCSDLATPTWSLAIGSSKNDYCTEIQVTRHEQLKNSWMTDSHILRGGVIKVVDIVEKSSCMQVEFY